MTFYDFINPQLELSFERDFGVIQLLSIAFLSAVARGEVDVQSLCEYELGQRGVDANGQWVGYDAKTNPLVAKYEKKQ